MKKYLFGLIAVAIASFSLAFTKAAHKDAPRANHYFQFVGTRNSQEGTNTKWNEITQAQYNNLSCLQAHLGCALITTSVVTISGSVRPSAVPLVAGTKDPTTGSGVITVANFQQ